MDKGGIKEILNNKDKLRNITKSAFESVDIDKSGFLEVFYTKLKVG